MGRRGEVRWVGCFGLSCFVLSYFVLVYSMLLLLVVLVVLWWGCGWLADWLIICFFGREKGLGFET